MENIPLAAFVLAAVAVLIIGFVVLSDKGETFDAKVVENQGCQVMCTGIGYPSFLDLSAEDCLENRKTPDSRRFMKQQNSDLENGCCCVNE